MAFVRLANAHIVLLQLSLLLCCVSITVYGDATLANHPPAEAPHSLPPHPHHHHHHGHHGHPSTPPTHPPTLPPSPAPVKPPTHPPVKPPTKQPAPPSRSPAKPPSFIPYRKMVAVQGVVICKSCKFRGVETLMGGSPLAGAVVKLQCNNTKYGLVEQTKTDKNGYFFFMPQKLTTAAFHKCKVFLVSSPVAACNVSTNLHGGSAGALLVPTVKSPVKAPFQLFSVGPFAFEPHKKLPCKY
ncbi:hypothetical protein OROGR_003130 [Orobanche gracilis]